MRPDLKKRLLDSACAPYRTTGVFNYRWARGKLGGDPIFTALIDQKIFPDNARVIDLGCGRGLLAAWFLAAEHLANKTEWLIKPPVGLSFRGVELMEREAECGNLALQPLYGNRVQLSGGNMIDTDISEADVIAVLDVLHYISYAEQDKLLDRIRSSLTADGIFVTRIGNADGGLRFTISRLVDTYMSFMQGHRLSRMWCRSLDDWTQALASRGFSVKTFPMSKGTPFANHMLVAHLS